MKRNEFVALKGLEIKELMLKADGIRAEIADATMDKNRNILKDLKSIDKRRKDIAKILTLINQKMALEKIAPKLTEKAKEVVSEKKGSSVKSAAEIKKGGSKEVKTQK